MRGQVTWRANRAFRLLFLGFATFCAFASLVPYSDATYTGSVETRLALGALAVALVWSVLRPRVRLAHDALEFRGVVRTQQLRLADLERVEPYRNGLAVTTKAGKTVLGPWGIGQKHEWSRRTESGADRMALQIMAAARDTSGR